MILLRKLNSSKICFPFVLTILLLFVFNGINVSRVSNLNNGKIGTYIGVKTTFNVSQAGVAKAGHLVDSICGFFVFTNRFVFQITSFYHESLTAISTLNLAIPPRAPPV